MDLHNLAQMLSTELGPAYHLRQDYEFVIPSTTGLSVGRADAAIFASAVPSIHTAVVGFHSFDGLNGNKESVLDKFAYLGAPWLIGETSGALSLYKYSGGSIAETIDERKSPEWVRARVLQDVDSPQLRLPLATSRALLVQDTRDALAKTIFSLMERAQRDQSLGERDSFRVAMVAIRLLILPGSTAVIPLSSALAKYARSLARQVAGQISFANVPPESIAELYEAFAVTDEDRRRRGVVYTPAWLARYVVDRLPPATFAIGKTLDPTCGSGTFLVCVLERVVEHAHRHGKNIDADILRRSVCGLDFDPVAIEAARLSLDMFAHAIGVSSVAWELSVDDATVAKPTSEWLVGNLPFGYRTYQGQRDISSVILTHLHNINPALLGFSLILPDSLAYAEGPRSTRALLRSQYNIQEVTRLPEGVFERSTAATMVVTARKGAPVQSVMVREIRDEDLLSLRAGIQLSTAFYADFPPGQEDPWLFSPFTNAFDTARLRGLTLNQIAAVRIGLQIYGMPKSPLGKPTATPTRPLLTDPKTFGRWDSASIERLPSLKAERSEVRRQGPWDSFPAAKVILRSTTDRKIYDRLAAIPDTQGVWFTDKFVGVWPSDETVSVRALAAYFQTRFARAWYQTNNPSRKLRVRVLALLPVPKLPAAAWARAAELAPPDRVVRPPMPGSEATLKLLNGSKDKEWEWFNATVEAAFGLDPVSSSRLVQWLAREE